MRAAALYFMFGWQGNNKIHHPQLKLVNKFGNLNFVNCYSVKVERNPSRNLLLPTNVPKEFMAMRFMTMANQ